ncbi:uncharacterized protein LOC111394991 [Olea europaea var. sylvestris]|uniref:uncharacterized protein LOC111394991 n=1 Tax=Olea europaea var. sylvestris TaxID=158386 RepID=UPI000C1CD62C|nr:uncharacterized protein LOC111394991 [Olea europaea var. sylvestris]
MKKPPSYTKGGPLHVCKLVKSLYGHKQASRQWYSKFSSSLIAFGFHQSKADYSRFAKADVNSFTALLVYVDDIIVASNCSTSIASLKAFLHNQFKIKDPGCLRYFLGLEVASSSKGIHLSQRKYTLDILSDSGMPLPDPSSYRRLIGCLLYLAITRPDISYAVQLLSQFMDHPTDSHLSAAHKVLRYLKNDHGQGILLSSSSQLQLGAYCDSDSASCLDTRRSTTGFCVFLGRSLVSWKSKKQSVVSRSSAEVEYRSMTSTCSELTWIRFLLRDLQRTKHSELDCHLVRDKIQEGSIITSHIASQSQMADIFTKALPTYLLHLHLSKMGIVNLYSPSCRGLLHNTHPAHGQPIQADQNTTPVHITSCSDASLKDEKV